MSAIRATLWVLGLLLVSVSQAAGQVGPAVIPAPVAVSVVTPALPVPALAKTTTQALAEALGKLGLKTRIVTPAIGKAYCLIDVKEKDGDLTVELKTDRGIWLTARLDQLPREKLDAAKLLRFLEANDAASPCFFFYRAADNRLCLKLEVVNPSDHSFLADLQSLTTTARATHNLWRAK